MTKEEVAEECGYEKVKGFVVLANEQPLTFDLFIHERELKEYWYNEVNGLFYEDTEDGLKKLCDDEEKNSVDKENEQKT
jgi:hypothetical protein